MSQPTNNEEQAKSSESYVGMPLKDEVKNALAERAEKNGRSTGREAAVIVTKVVMRDAAK